MDPVDEFEMKPLTTGLGFQKRAISLKEHLKNSGAASQSLRRALPEQPPAELTSDTPTRSSKEIISELHDLIKKTESGEKLTPPHKKSTLQLTEILPRDNRDVPKPKSTPGSVQMPNINFQIPDKKMTEGTGTRRGAHDDLRPTLEPVAGSFSALILDGVVVFAITLLFLVSLVLVTKVDLASVLRSSQTEFATQLSLFVLYLAVYEMYAISSRSFFGCTLGEWTFDLQMGNDEQIRETKYPVLVLARTLISLLTGIILLPLLSLILRRDLAAKVTGLQLYKKNV